MKRKRILGVFVCVLMAAAAALPVFCARADAADIRTDFGMHGLSPRGDGSYYGPAAYGNRVTYNEKVYLNPCEIELELLKFDCDNDFWYAVLFNVGRNSYIGSEDVLGVMIRIYRTGLEYTAIGVNGQPRSEKKTSTRPVSPDDTLRFKLKAEIVDEQVKFTVSEGEGEECELTVSEERYVSGLRRGAFLSVGFNHMNQESYTSEFKVTHLQTGTRTDSAIVYGSSVSESDRNIAPLSGVGKPYRTSLRTPMTVLFCLGGAGIAASVAILIILIVKNKNKKQTEENGK